MGKKQDISFEDALAALETIVNEMESGELTLEEGVNRFEQGMKLAQICSEELNESEKKIEILTRNAETCLKWQQVSPEEENLAPDEDFRLE